MSSNDDDLRDQGDAMGLDLFDEQAEQQVRRVWHEERWFFSVIDVVGLLTENSTPRRYWSDLKRKLHDEGFQLYEKIVQLKMAAPDGKQRLTDAADTETLLRIIQSVPSPKAEPFKQWLARVGAQRLEELDNPQVAADSLRLLYRQRGYNEEWIEQRLQSIVVRDDLTTEWRDRGAEEGREFAILTEILHRGAFEVTTDQHRQIKQLKQRENLRDNMTSLELALTMLSEATATGDAPGTRFTGVRRATTRRRRGGRDRRERAPADRNTHWAARGEQRECEEPDGQGETTTTLRAGQRSKRTI